MSKDSFVRPDVEHVTEGLRVPPHRVSAYRDDAAADRARRFWDAVWLIVLAAVVFLAERSGYVEFSSSGRDTFPSGSDYIIQGY